MNTKINVMLVNEHKILGDLIRSSLTYFTNFNIESEYADGQEALDHALLTKPELMLTGIDLPGLDGIALAKKLMERLPETKILAVTHYPEVDRMIPFLAAGGRGYLCKFISDKDLISTVETVLNGDIALSKEGFQLAAKQYRRIAMDGANTGKIAQPERLSESIHALSAREKQVLQLYAHGYSNKEICQLLFLSTNTVETHKKRVRQKLQIKSKAELMQYAKKHGLLEDWEV